MGIGLYAATALLSLTGMAWVSKKRKNWPFHNGGIVCRREKEKETLRRLFFCDFYEFIPPQRRACGY